MIALNSFIALYLIPIILNTTTIRTEEILKNNDFATTKNNSSTIIQNTTRNLLTDTTNLYITNSIHGDYIDLINLSFCIPKLMNGIAVNKTLEKQFCKELISYQTRWKNEFWGIISIKGLVFFKEMLKNDSTTAEKYRLELIEIDSILDNVKDTIVQKNTYQSLLKRYKSADGAVSVTQSGSCYVLLVTNTCDFLESASTNKTSTNNYTGWISNIESNEFVAMRDDGVPASILESKRFYILNRLEDCQPSTLKQITIERIKSAQIRIIN